MHYSEEQLQEMALYNPRQYELIRSLSEPPQEEQPEPQQDEQQGEASETQEPEPEPVTTPEPVETPKEEVQEEVKDLDYFKKKAAESDSWKKRAGDAKAELTPVQQKNAEMEAKLAAMEARLREIQENAAKGNTQEEAHDDFEEEFPSIDRKLKAENAKLQARLDELEKKFSSELSPIKESAKQANERLQKEQAEAAQAKHFATLCSLHSDAGDYFDPEKLGPAFYEWGSTLKPYQQKVLQAPDAYDPADVADIIGKFKQEVLSHKPTKQTPASGDLASRITNQAGNKGTSKPEGDLMNDFEFNNINRLMHAAAQQGGNAMNQLMEKYERTLKSKERNQ